MLWLRRWGIRETVQWQTDWGEEFGGSNPKKLKEIEERFYLPLEARLKRIPKERKGYNGRVERSHLTDDYEFYIPFVLEIVDERDWLRKLQVWQYIYNVKRPHFGKSMEGKTPLEKLQEVGYKVDERFAMFPIVILDSISSEWVLGLHGNDVLAMDMTPFRMTCSTNSLAILLFNLDINLVFLGRWKCLTPCLKP